MRARSLPTIDAGYWVAIVAASMCGANAGDLAAGPLGLGHIRGVLPLLIIFFGILWVERKLSWRTVAYYWLAIIVLRTMATNLADLATHDLKIPHPLFEIALLGSMAVMLWIDTFRRAEGSRYEEFNGARRNLPATDWTYWIVMLAAGTLGTALGDWIAEREGLGLGVYWASAIGIPLFAITLWGAYRWGMSKTWYWLAIVACRTWGTDLGDMLVTLFRTVVSRPHSLWISTALTATLLVCIIAFWKHKSMPTKPVADNI
jgi:uncharacterized membrane-anchored protein